MLFRSVVVVELLTEVVLPFEEEVAFPPPEEDVVLPSAEEDVVTDEEEVELPSVPAVVVVVVSPPSPLPVHATKQNTISTANTPAHRERINLLFISLFLSFLKMPCMFHRTAVVFTKTFIN